jgi:phage N-6-adenine-methyltransferase
MTMNDGLYSSKESTWETPQDLFDRLNEEFHFDIDVCASVENNKCTNFYSKEDDGLSKEWSGSCWMNPPYGKEIGLWVKKASEIENGIVVCLLPARTDTKYFHEYIYNKAEIRFIKGRLKFSNSKNSAPFPSMIVVFRSNGAA